MITPPLGLSPRVRGNQDVGLGGEQEPGSIPACAGEPPGCAASPRMERVYPRVCGGTPVISAKPAML